MAGLELIGEIYWSNTWIRSQMIGVRDRLADVDGRIKSNTLNQWYLRIHSNTFAIQINRKEKIITLFEMIGGEWIQLNELESFFSFEIWLEEYFSSKEEC